MSRTNPQRFLLASLLTLAFLMSCKGGLLGNIGDDSRIKYPELTLIVDGAAVSDDGVVSWPDTFESDTSTMVITIKNTGENDLELTGAPKLSIDPDTHFEITVQPPSYIVAGGEEPVEVTFTPGGLGDFSAACTIESNTGGSSSFVINLEGKGIADPETPVPTNITATSGTMTSKVTVTWTPVAGATYYQVYRYPAESSPDENDVPADTLLGGSQDSWDDDTVNCVPGTVYDYYVRANSTAYGLSGFSQKASGYRALSTVTGVDAGWGTETGWIEVEWNAVAGAQEYDIYRSTSSSMPGSPTFEGVSEPYSDVTAVAGERYFYWVRARGDTAASPGPVSNTPGQGCLGLLPPDDLVLSEGWFYIGVDWDDVPGATGYHIEASANVYQRVWNPGIGDFEVTIDYWTDYLDFGLNGDSRPDDSHASLGVSYPDSDNIEEWGEAFADHMFRVRTYNSDLDIYSGWYEDPDVVVGVAGG